MDENSLLLTRARALTYTDDDVEWGKNKCCLRKMWLKFEQQKFTSEMIQLATEMAAGIGWCRSITWSLCRCVESFNNAIELDIRLWHGEETLLKSQTDDYILITAWKEIIADSFLLITPGNLIIEFIALEILKNVLAVSTNRQQSSINRQ